MRKRTMLQSESDYLTLEGRYVLLIKPERVLPRLVLISLAFIRFPCVIVSLRSYYFLLLSPLAACFSAFERNQDFKIKPSAIKLAY